LAKTTLALGSIEEHLLPQNQEDKIFAAIRNELL
jgi:hypothetical protein